MGEAISSVSSACGVEGLWSLYFSDSGPITFSASNATFDLVAAQIRLSQIPIKHLEILKDVQFGLIMGFQEHIEVVFAANMRIRESR